MTLPDSALHRFDTAAQRLKEVYGRQREQRILNHAVTTRREALRAFLETHHRLPSTLHELVSAKIVPQFIYFLDGVRDLPDRGKSLTLAEFLECTAAVDDESARRSLNVHIGSVLSLYLVRALYDWSPMLKQQVPDQSNAWTSVAFEVLERKGFSREQLELIKSDTSVRSALAQVLKATLD